MVVSDRFYEIGLDLIFGGRRAVIGLTDHDFCWRVTSNKHELVGHKVLFSCILI